jgi:hypothetical protein
MASEKILEYNLIKMDELFIKALLKIINIMGGA